MKKNNIMRIACALLVLTLLSTCVMSGTFAKYVTELPGTEDNARVAAWGVTITGTGVAFSDSYKDTATTYTADEALDTITVQSATPADKVVAPGTNGTLAAFDIAGTPEVDTAVTYTADLVLAGWEVDSAVYCPIIFTVKDDGVATEYYVGKDTIADTDDLETAVEAAIVAAKADYHTNDDLSDVEDDLVVSWAWAFENEAKVGQTDVKDTALGNAAAGMNGGTAATIELTVGAKIVQKD